MARREILLCLLILCTTLYVVECRGGHGGSHGGGHGHSSHGSSGGHSSHGSHSSGSHGGGFFSWFSSGSRGSGSGSGGTSYSSGSNSHSYPSSGSGMSGYGSNSGSSSGGSHTYPSSGSGMSGYGSHSDSSSGGSHTYPSSGSGMSGNGGGYNSGTHWRTSNSHNTYYGYRPGSPQKDSYITPVTYTHYPQHVYVTEYQNSGSRYGDLLSGLTWYNLGRSHDYHYNNHYYNDDYYRRWHSSSSSNGYKLDKQPEESAVCTLRVSENGKLEVLKIPCAIVSTFIDDSQEIINQHEYYVNTAVCTTNSTVTKRIVPVGVTNKPNVMNTANNKPGIPADLPALNLVSYNPYQNNEKPSYYNDADRILEQLTQDMNNYKNIGVIGHGDDDDAVRNYGIFSRTTTERSRYNSDYNGDINKILDDMDINGYINRINSQNFGDYSNTYFTEKAKVAESTTLKTTTTTTTLKPTTEKPIIEEKNTTEGNTTVRTVKIITSDEEIVNVTVCKNMTDPVSVKGPSINASNMLCEVAVKTKDAYLRNKVDCKTLLNYAKNPPPKQESVVLPEKEKLRSWVQNTPWWTSIFIAV